MRLLRQRNRGVDGGAEKCRTGKRRNGRTVKNARVHCGKYNSAENAGCLVVCGKRREVSYGKAKMKSEH